MSPSSEVGSIQPKQTERNYKKEDDGVTGPLPAAVLFAAGTWDLGYGIISSNCVPNGSKIWKVEVELRTMYEEETHE